MQFATIVSSLLIAAGASVQAAPLVELDTRQVMPFTLALLSDNACTTRYSSSFPNNGTACQIISQPAASVFAGTTLPATCTIKLYSDKKCSSVNVLTVPHDSSCVSFGNTMKITSLRVSGQCPGFQQS